MHKHPPEPVPREPHRLIAHRDPAFVQEILDLAQRRKTEAGEYHRKVDDLWAVLELEARKALYHAGRLRDARLGLKPSASANTPARSVGSLRSARQLTANVEHDDDVGRHGDAQIVPLRVRGEINITAARSWLDFGPVEGPWG